MPNIIVEVVGNRALVELYSGTKEPKNYLKSVPCRLQVEGRFYDFLSHGNHNLAYRSTDGCFVFKCAINSETDPTDTPERSIRLWNLLNPGFPAKVAYLHKKAIGWIAPFIRGTQPMSDEIIKKLFEIYQQTGRVVVDGFVKTNFIKTVNGDVVCIDVGFALQLENRKGRQQSEESLDFWNRNCMSRVYTDTFFDTEKEFPHLVPIIDATKALLYLQMHRPDFRQVAYLYLNKALMKELVMGYDENNKSKDPNLTQIISNLDSKLSAPLLEHSVASPITRFFSSTTVTVGSSDESESTISSDHSSPLQPRLTLKLFAENFVQNKKPKSWLDRLAESTTAAWCDKLY